MGQGLRARGAPGVFTRLFVLKPLGLPILASQAIISGSPHVGVGFINLLASRVGWAGSNAGLIAVGAPQFLFRGGPPRPPVPAVRLQPAGARPDDRRRVRAQAGFLLGRQPGSRLSAPLPRRGRARLAGAAGARGALARGDGGRVRGRRRQPAVRAADRAGVLADARHGVTYFPSISRISAEGRLVAERARQITLVRLGSTSGRASAGSTDVTKPTQ